MDTYTNPLLHASNKLHAFLLWESELGSTSPQRLLMTNWSTLGEIFMCLTSYKLENNEYISFTDKRHTNIKLYYKYRFSSNFFFLSFSRPSYFLFCFLGLPTFLFAWTRWTGQRVRHFSVIIEKRNSNKSFEAIGRACKMGLLMYILVFSA